MVLFNVLNIFVYLFHIKNPYITALLNCLLEITGGLNRFFQMNQNTPFTLMIIFTSLIFGGLSCLAQTMSILNNSDLDKKKYLVNKLILTTICGVYYGFVFFAF